MTMLRELSTIKEARTLRQSSWERNGRNADFWTFEPGESRIIADIKGPGAITHVWMTQPNHYREVLIKITWDDAEGPSVLCPLGDFFGLGHSIVNSYQSLFFSASTRANNQFNMGCALNCYLYMPFRKHAVVELVNESNEIHRQYFYVDYELYDDESVIDGKGYLHAEFHRENPFGGWGHEIRVNSPEANISNKERLAWDNNYVILETKGRGHYLGCNISITNFQGTWWGEGDDMIWVDGYKWPPDLHGTGSEDYLNQAWGMQDNAFLRNGSSIYEMNTGGYQTSYVFHVENPVRFNKEIKVTIEHGHGNHLRNEVSSVAYWYAEKPSRVKDPPPVLKRLPVRKDANGNWIHAPENQVTTREVPLNEEMILMKRRWKAKSFQGYVGVKGKLIFDDQGIPCLETTFSDDPGAMIHQVPLAEFLEDFDEKKVSLLVKCKEPHVSGSGVLSVGEDGSVTVRSGAGDISLSNLLGELDGTTLELEVLAEFDENDDEKITGYTVVLQ